MGKSIMIFALILTFISCKNKNQNLRLNRKVEKQNIEIPSETIVKRKRIGDFLSDTTNYYWYAKQSDTASYWIRIVFQKEFAVYQFHGQCAYWFFTNHYYTGTDKVELLWTYKNDCLLEMDFLRKSNGIRKFPKTGDPFCEYKLVNDSVIEAKYNFPEWTNKINKMEKDSIFPKFFYLEKKTNI